MSKTVMEIVGRELARPFRRWGQRQKTVSKPPPGRPRVPRPRAEGSPAAAARVPFPSDFLPHEIEIIKTVAPFTLTSPERVWSLINACRHIVQSDIPGDIVECGVWKGGSMMAAALTLLQLGNVRDLHLFDTFEGMPPPGHADRDFAGRSAAERLIEEDRATSPIWCVAGLEDVRRNLLSTGYPAPRLHFVAGRVEETIPAKAPEKIALLRLDTDWYESTRHELVHLYQRLSVGGVLIIDDYGYWQGARKACDEFLASLARPPLLCRIDSTGRIAIKTA